MGRPPPRLLSLAPHPDDELLGAGGTALALAARGWRVTVLACGLGRPEDHRRRRAELERACAWVGFALELHRPPLALGAGDDLGSARAALAATLRARLAEQPPALVLAPSPHDAHHAHRTVGLALRDALEARPGALTVWWWSLWGELEAPTLVVDVGEVLPALEAALGAHAGELARGDYADLPAARSRHAAITGPERVLGFGVPQGLARHAELLAETTWAEGAWRFGAPRVLDPAAPTPAAAATGPPAGWWLHARSVAQELAALRRETATPR